jgi:selenocysteine lyase/cysteine desulfurase
LNLPIAKGQSIIVLEEQFPSNYYAWQRLAQQRGAKLEIVPWPSNGDWTSAVLERLAGNVGIAALPHVQWSSGGRLDLVRIGEACRRIGASLALDLTQSLGALPFSVREVQPDFAVAATYKWLLGPYSMGALYVAPKWHGGSPLEENWIQRAGADNFSSLALYADAYADAARRFDMGERANFALMPAAIAAMEQVLTWGIPAISEYSGALNAQLAAAAQDLGFDVLPEKYRAPHYLCLRRQDGIDPALAANLAAQKVFVSIRGASMRLTPNVYNSEADVARLIQCCSNSRKSNA